MASAVVGALRVMLEVNAAHFSSEFKKAETTIGNFDKLVSNTSRSLGRMVDSFSGHKIVAEAAKMAEAVQRVGGVSVLTERELSRVASTVNEATAKLRAMGAEVPPSIARLSGEIGSLGAATKTAGGFMSSFSGIAGALGPILPVASVAGLATGLIGLGKTAFDSAGKIADLSSRTGISTETIQRMQHVAEQTGTSLDSLTAGAFRLGVTIEKGGKQAENAIRELGLSFEQLRGMSAEQQFHAVIAALEGMDDATKRNALGTALFGRQFAEFAASVSQGYTKIAQAATVTSDAQIQALDKAADAWAKFKLDLVKDVESTLGTIVMLAQGSFGSLQISAERLRKEINEGLASGKDITHLQEELNRVLSKTGDKALAKDTSAAAVATRDYVKELTALNAELAKLTPQQKQQLDAAIKLEGANEEVAAAFGLTEQQLRLYQSQTKASIKVTNEAAEAMKKFRASVSDMTMLGWAPFKEAVRDAGQELQNIARGLEGNGNLMSGTIQDMGQAQAAAAKWAHEMGAVLAPAMHAFSGSLNEVQLKTQETAGVMESVFSGIGDSIVRAIQGGGDILKAAGSQLGLNLANEFVKKFGDTVKGLFGSVLGGIFNSLIPGLGSLLGPLLGKIGSFFKNLFGIDPAVKAARSALEEFQSTLRAGLTDQQKQEAGNRDWAKDLIRVRDAYLAIGKTAEEAEKDVAAMWDTDNPEKSQAAIEKIQKALEEAERKLREGQEAAEDLADAVEDIPTDITVRVRADFDGSDIPPWVDDPDRPRESGGFGDGPSTSSLTAPLSVPDLGQTSAFSAGTASALAADPGVATPAPASATPASTGTSVHVMPFMVGETWQQVKVGFQRYLETTGLSSGRAREIIDSIASDAARRVAVRG